VGKTTTASLLAAKLGVPVRHCSEILLREAERQGLSEPLPVGLHYWLDTDSRLWLQGIQSGLIIEGRFLHRVLVNESEIVFVRLTCSLDERVRRVAASEDSPNPATMLLRSDEEDQAHELRIYGPSLPSGAALLEIDTSRYDPTEVVREILSVVPDVD